MERGNWAKSRFRFTGPRSVRNTITKNPARLSIASHQARCHARGDDGSAWTDTGGSVGRSLGVRSCSERPPPGNDWDDKAFAIPPGLTARPRAGPQDPEFANTHAATKRPKQP